METIKNRLLLVIKTSFATMMNFAAVIAALLLFFPSSSVLVEAAKDIVFTLRDDSTSSDLFELNDGAIVDLNEFDFKSLVIRADVTKNPSIVKMVVFDVDGISQTIDSRPPFILGGGLKASGHPKQPIVTPGKHTLTVTAIFENGKTKTHTVSFEALDPTNAPTTVPVVSISLTLVDSASDEDVDMAPLTEGSVVDISKVGLRLNIRADIGYNVTAMDFWFDGEFIRTEFFAPYSLGGDRLANYRKFIPLATTGKHDINVRAFVGTTLVGQRRIGFHVIDKTFTPTATKYPTWSPADASSGRPHSFSDMPSTVPSDMPSDMPSSMPSDMPSSMPSDAPSSMPSDLPSSMPSDVPSSMPSDVPSIGEDNGVKSPPSQPMEKAFDAPSSPPSVVEGMTVIYIPPLDKYVTDYFVDAGADKKKPKYFTGVATRSYTNKKATILGADPYSDSLFQTYRRAKWMNYTFPGLVPRSMNKVKLGFAEILDANCLQEPGARVFDVTVNDMPFLSNFDVLTVVPCHTVHFVEGIWVADATGRIVIGFKSIRGMAFVSVIEIETVG